MTCCNHYLGRIRRCQGLQKSQHSTAPQQPDPIPTPKKDHVQKGTKRSKIHHRTTKHHGRLKSLLSTYFSVIKKLLRDNLFYFFAHVVTCSEVLHGLFSMGDAVVHGLLDSKHDLNWDEDQVDANNDLTFGDGAVEDDWRANHTKVFGLTGLPGQ